MHTRWCRPTRPAWSSTTTGTRWGCASGSNSVSLEGVELPEAGVRGGFVAGDVLPYMERNLHSGLFHAAASLGIAESADVIARRGIAGRIVATRARVCRWPTMRWTSPSHAACCHARRS